MKQTTPAPQPRPRPQPLTQEQIAAGKRDCGQLLDALGYKHSTKHGRAVVRAYWLGLLRGAGDPDCTINVAVTILILGNRWAELASKE